MLFRSAFRERLAATAAIGAIGAVETQHSRRDGTTKYLFALADGRRIESVLIPPRTAFSGEAGDADEQLRHTLCVSSQVGCPLDCAFCATATMGFLRNLTAGEIVDQVIQAQALSGKRITNVVFMGMGEPMLNYENVMKAAEIIATGLKITARRITVSTAGWAPQIRRMADERRRVKLAVSLHALDDDTRTRLMPVNAKYPLAELLDAVAYYYAALKERVTFEYILFAGVNDRDEDLRRLAALSRRIPSKVNIIPYHDIAFAGAGPAAARLRPSAPAASEAFVRRLREAHVTVFVRSSAGEDIEAACGQLAVREAGRRAAGMLRQA